MRLGGSGATKTNWVVSTASRCLGGKFGRPRFADRRLVLLRAWAPSTPRGTAVRGRECNILRRSRLRALVGENGHPIIGSGNCPGGLQGCVRVRSFRSDDGEYPDARRVATMRPDLQRVEERLEEAARVDFPMVSDLILGLVRAGGKRLRPLVLLLAGRAHEFDRDTLVTAGAGVELLHTASLVHDDTVDRAALRRGRPTLNSVLSSRAVILLGDYLFAQSAMLAAATNSPRSSAFSPRPWPIFATVSSARCSSRTASIKRARSTSGASSARPRRSSPERPRWARSSAAPRRRVQALRQYGSDVGMAFQIVDDVLDLREGTQQLGKPAGTI